MNATERYLGKSTKHGRTEEEEGKRYFHGEKMSQKYGGNYVLRFFTKFVLLVLEMLLVLNCVLVVEKSQKSDPEQCTVNSWWHFVVQIVAGCQNIFVLFFPYMLVSKIRIEQHLNTPKMRSF